MPAGRGGSSRVGEVGLAHLRIETVAAGGLLIGQALGEVGEITHLVEIDDTVAVGGPDDRAPIGHQRVDQRIQPLLVDHHGVSHESTLADPSGLGNGRRS